MALWHTATCCVITREFKGQLHDTYFTEQASWKPFHSCFSASSCPRSCKVRRGPKSESQTGPYCCKVVLKFGIFTDVWTRQKSGRGWGKVWLRKRTFPACREIKSLTSWVKWKLKTVLNFPKSFIPIIRVNKLPDLWCNTVRLDLLSSSASWEHLARCDDTSLWAESETHTPSHRDTACFCISHSPREKGCISQRGAALRRGLQIWDRILILCSFVF